MKTVSFIAGNQADASRGMQIHVNRSRVPAGARVGLWLDDDGTLYPQIPRPALTQRKLGLAVTGGASNIDFTLLTRARVRATAGGLEGVLTLEPGTRFELENAVQNPFAARTMEVKGAELSVRAGRRFAQVQAAVGEIHLDKLPNQAHVLTLEWEPPPGAVQGEKYRVDVEQRTASGALVGGLTVEFLVD